MMRRLILLAGAMPVLVTAQTIQCPQALPEGSIEIRQAPEGWHASSPTAVRLDGGGMLSEDPKKMQYLVPSNSRKVKGGGTSIWSFDPGEQKWVYCTYGRMAVQLAKRMDDQATTCQVTVKYERKDVVAEITAVCR